MQETEMTVGNRVCCNTDPFEQHNDQCEVIVKLDQSYKQDAGRAVDSYTNHTATALIKRTMLLAYTEREVRSLGKDTQHQLI